VISFLSNWFKEYLGYADDFPRFHEQRRKKSA
jgi:hypothetical protein